MWNFIKGLFKGKKRDKVVEQQQEANFEVLYEYPKTPLELTPVRSQRKSHQERHPIQPIVPQISVREWIDNCKEVEQYLLAIRTNKTEPQSDNIIPFRRNVG
jgi:hypothetical protein